MQSTIVRAKRSSTDLGIIPELLKLMKPRVMSLVIFTCAVGLLTAVSKPTAQVNITKDITLGFMSFSNSGIIPRSVLDLFALTIVDCILINYNL